MSGFRVLIADDHSILRKGLAQVIAAAGYDVIAEAADGEEALRGIVEMNPDVAVLDIEMPKRDGFFVARAVKQQRLRCELAFLTLYKDELHLEEALRIGVRGYVVKEAATNEVVSCIAAVAGGGTYISPSLSAHLVQFACRTSDSGGAPNALNELTATEKRVLVLLADLKTNKEVAAELGISPRTVENHRAHICEKLKLRGTHALTRYAMQHRGRLVE